MKQNVYISGGLIGILVLTVFVSFNVKSGNEFLGRFSITEDTQEIGEQDFDGDGYTNQEEKEAGTDMLDPEDHPNDHESVNSEEDSKTNKK